MISFDFFPNIDRAIALDQGMHRELAASLQHIATVCEIEAPSVAEALQGTLDVIEQHGPVTPASFGRYYELTRALLDDDFDTALILSRELRDNCSAVAITPVVCLGDPDLADSGLYHRVLNADASDIAFLAPDPDMAQAFRHRLASGFRLLDKTLPQLAGEIRAIVRQVVIASGDPAAPMQFDGASHFQLWGALFLNGKFHADAIAVAEVLAHESAHSVLFGFCTETALVENEDDELFASPLRKDPRPMDGIFHATFVSARMHWAMSELSRSDVLTAAERNRAREAAQADVANFNSGYDVVREHGRLTRIGSALIEGAHAYMQSAAVRR